MTPDHTEPTCLSYLWKWYTTYNKIILVSIVHVIPRWFQHLFRQYTRNGQHGVHGRMLWVRGNLGRFDRGRGAREVSSLEARPGVAGGVYAAGAERLHVNKCVKHKTYLYMYLFI